MGGMVLETNMTEILTRIEEQTRIEKQEVGVTGLQWPRSAAVDIRLVGGF